MSLAYNVLVNAPDGSRLIPVPCEIVSTGKRTARVRLPNGDVIKVKRARLVAPPIGGPVEAADAAPPPPEAPFFVGMKVILHDTQHKVNVKVSRVTGDAVFFMLGGKEYQLHESQLYDPDEHDAMAPAFSLKEVPADGEK